MLNLASQLEDTSRSSDRDLLTARGNCIYHLKLKARCCRNQKRWITDNVINVRLGKVDDKDGFLEKAPLPSGREHEHVLFFFHLMTTGVR